MMKTTKQNKTGKQHLWEIQEAGDFWREEGRLKSNSTFSKRWRMRKSTCCSHCWPLTGCGDRGQLEEASRASCLEGLGDRATVLPREAAGLSGVDSFSLRDTVLLERTRRCWKWDQGRCSRKVSWVKNKKQRLGFPELLNDTTLRGRSMQLWMRELFSN